MTSASDRVPTETVPAPSPAKSVPKAEAAPSETAKEEDTKLSEEAVRGIMQDGRKFFALAKYQDAADAFSKATEALYIRHFLMEFGERDLMRDLRDALYGEGDLRTGDAWFHYGKTLLALARSSTDLFGASAIPKTAEESTGFSLPLASETKKRGFQFGGDEEEDPENHVDDEDDEEDAGEEEDKEEASPEEKAFAQGVDAQFEEAWQVLETARVIYAKSTSQGDRRRLADIYDLLADLNLENEHFDESVEDYTSALAIRQEVYPSTDRMIAQNCYKLAIAYEYSERIMEAMKFYAMAAMTLKSKLNALKATKTPQEEEETKKEEEEETEEEELAQLVSEIELKLRDLKQSLTQQNDEAKARAAIKAPSAFGSSGFSAPSQAATNAFAAPLTAPTAAPVANDLSSMIKKKPVAANVLPATMLKRKPEEAPEESSAKEIKVDQNPLGSPKRSSEK